MGPMVVGPLVLPLGRRGRTVGGRRAPRPWALPLAGTVLLAALGFCAAGCGRRAPAPSLVLLISVDTLRADRLGAYGCRLGLSPRLDALAAESLVFEAAYAPSSFTMPSVSTLLTGRYPEQNGVHGNKSLLPLGIPTLASLLKERGFRTGAVVSNWVLRQTPQTEGSTVDRGFDHYDDRFPEQEANRQIPERLAPDTTAAGLAMLDRLRGEGEAQKTFLWVHYQDPHGPYTPPEGYRERYLAAESERPWPRTELPRAQPEDAPPGVPEFEQRGLASLPSYQALDGRSDPAFYAAGYDGEVRWTDEELARLLDGIAQRGLLDDAVIVFVADHGEAMGEADYWFAHGEYLSDPLVRVPLFLRLPGHSSERRTDVVALADVAPTLLALFGIEPPAEMLGRDLLAPAPPGGGLAYLATSGGAIRSRRGLVRDGWKYLVTDLGGGRVAEELYRLGDERTNLVGSEPERRQLLQKGLMVTMERVQTDVVGRPRALSEADMELMRKLGYVGED